MFRRKLGIVFGIMLVFSIAGACLVSAFGKRGTEEEEGLLVAASFYPVWIITENVCAAISTAAGDAMTSPRMEE